MQGIGQLLPENPILTKLMFDYANAETQYAARRLFPYVETERDAGTIYASDAENSLRNEDSEWGRNTAATVVDIRLGSKTFQVHPRAYMTPITKSDKRNFAGPGSLERFVARKLMDRFLVNREVKAEATIRGSSAIQSQAAGAAWNAASVDGLKDYAAADAKIIKAIGKRATDLWIPPAVWDARFMTNATNTIGLQIKSQLGYVLATTQDNINPTLVGKWFGASRCSVPGAVKAGGNETTTAPTSGLTGGGYIWQDTTVVYLTYTEETPDIGTSAYGFSPGPQDIIAEEPYFDWFRKAEWYRVSSVFGEYEAVGKACCKITGV